MDKSASLCDTCRRAVTTLCKYMAIPDPAVGLMAMGATAKVRPTRYAMTLYRVTACPAFEAGELPPFLGKK